ncbi:UDP-glucuronosyltransferase 2A3 [Harpegnathos saltator]|uniref:UDP-glucuronosyltransferase 2A3 n=2 Tax=Harpegnathos saltator TaxID=610380 RepID=E2BZE7_HARSA|nr:UDP-glucuronosyltransferase 2A3 [Harpegnathos saltator]
MHNNGFLDRINNLLPDLETSNSDYLFHVSSLVTKYLPDVNVDIKDLYSDVRLVLWGGDTVLRSNFVPLTQLFVEVGCHHCRGVHPLPSDLQKSLITYKQGTIVVLLDNEYKTLVTELAKKLPKGREGQAVVWLINKNDKIVLPDKENLFVHTDIDRQDLIGYSRTRVVLSHCSDTEFLEAAFHGSPMICLPRDYKEFLNSERAVELGFARTVMTYVSADDLAKFTVQMIHETINYRENARKVSLALRDRLNPASDRLIYWLGYIARTKDSGSENLLRPTSEGKLFVEDRKLINGMLIGAFFGSIITIFCMVAPRIIDEYHQEGRLRRQHAL